MKVHNAMLFLFGAIIIVGAQFFGGVPGLVGAAFGFVWAFFLAYATKIRYVPTILVLCLPALGVRALGDFFFLPELGLTPVTLTFLGADWPTSLAVMVGAFLRIALRALQPRSLIWEIVPGILLFGFFGTLLLSLLSAYQGYELGLH